jgi:diguanylate cyclase
MSVVGMRAKLRLADAPGSGRPQGGTGRAGERKAGSDKAEYYRRIEAYAQKIRDTSDVGDIIALLDAALSETRALHTADEVALAHAQVAHAEERIGQLKSELELVSRLVQQDQLTGALNRRGLDEALAREIARAERAGTALCAALIDIDDFKRINDSFGHQVGDIVLVHLVAIVKETIRTNDLLGRYGGEEFLLLLPESRIDEATAVLARLQRELAEKSISWGHHKLVVKFSAGVASRRAGEAEAALVERADQALYQAKRSGKDRIVVAG